MRSGLVLAGANDVWADTVSRHPEDGVLTAQEASQLDMRNCVLIVLSACETGLGDIKGSEGVYGLQRALKIAGARFIVMSLWEIPDRETVEFMSVLYKNITETKDIRSAFHTARETLRAKYDPYYWASFVLLE
jgi:CHAT domain-containing protein